MRSISVSLSENRPRPPYRSTYARSSDRKAALDAGCDLLLMRALEPASTQREKLMFLTGVYSFGQIRRMERFFSGSAFFNRLYLEIYLKQPGASPISSEYRRIEEKLKTLS